ncbi:hypothetical protein F4810DRAFT_722785 [Camillea tinctor]|nr:hypothetical protein F4810DRAFT_722785 [Camillea tinctor]
MAETGAKLKYESLWGPCPPGISREDMAKAYNSANSRFVNKAKRDGRGARASSWARQKRERGITMLEALSALATEWQMKSPGNLPADKDEFCEHVLDHFKIVILPEFFSYTPEDGEDARAQLALGSGKFYHEEFPWMDIEVYKGEEGEEDEDGEEEE